MKFFFLSSTFIIEDSSELVRNNSIENKILYKNGLVQIFCRSVTFRDIGEKLEINLFDHLLQVGETS